MTTLHGIANCDTVRKARRWLDAQGIAHAFHDFRRGGVDEVRLRGWVERLGWEVLLNRAGTTFRTLPDAQKQGINAAGAITLMLAHPATIKRPVLERGDLLMVGFSEARYADALASR